MSLRLMLLSAMHSLIKWYLTLTCFVAAWLMGFRARRSAAWLSMYNLVDPGVPSWSSERSQHSQTSSLDASAAAIYSACVEEVATVLCCLDAQETVPPEYKKVYPEIKWWLRQLLAQSTSVYPMSSDSPIVYMMLQLGHPARYCMMSQLLQDRDRKKQKHVLQWTWVETGCMEEGAWIPDGSHPCHTGTKYLWYTVLGQWIRYPQLCCVVCIFKDPGGLTQVRSLELRANHTLDRVECCFIVPSKELVININQCRWDIGSLQDPPPGPRFKGLSEVSTILSGGG